jgi:hypothetical protein
MTSSRTVTKIYIAARFRVKYLFRQHLFQNTYIFHVHVVQYNTLMYPAVPAHANIAEIQDGAGPLQAICQLYLIPET